MALLCRELGCDQGQISCQFTARQINQLLFALVSGLSTVAHEADIMETLEHFCEARLMYRAELKLRNQRAGITKRAP